MVSITQMKKTTLRQAAMKLALVACVLLAPLGLRAQETLTVYDGTATNNFVPFYGSYVDTRTCNVEFIIPAETDGMSDMEGGVISKLTFYISGTPQTWGSPTIQVYMGEVNGTTLSSINGPTSFTIVYEGVVSNQTNPLEIELSDPYTYEGGNLLIGTYVSTASSTYKNTSFLGVSAPSGSSIYFSGSTYGSATVQSFLPKTTFTYEPAQQGGDVCEKPATCEVSNVTATSATLTWGGGSGTYNVELKAGSADWATVLSGTTLTTTSLTLQPTTTYQARVQSVCTGSTPTSGWKTSTSFTTPCASYDIPYTYGFEDAAPFACWTVLSGNITRINGTPNTGSYRLDFRGTTSNMIALPQFNEATDHLRVEFWTRPENTGGSSGKFAIGYMTDIANASSFVAVETYNSTEMTTTYVKKTVDMVGVPANAIIAMRQFDCSTNYYWYVDDVTVKEIPSCVAPTGLAANPSTTSAELSWTANSGETAWTLYYKKAADANYTEVTNATNPYTLQGLQAATSYLYYVVANCAAEDASEPSEPFAFTTACPEYAEAPFTENFDGYTVASTSYPSARVLPTCWSFINTSTYSTNKWYPTMQYYSYTNYSNSSPNYIRFYIDAYSGSNYDPQDQYLILPAVQDVADLRIKLQASVYNTGSTYDATFKVGIMTDPTDASTFVEIAEKTPTTTSYEQYIIPFNGYTGSGNHIAIKVEAPETPTASYTHAYRAVYIDDITVEEIPNCVEPSALQFVSSTTTTATLSWTAGGSETSWDIYYSTENVAPTTQTGTNTSDNPATIEGLAASTTYYVWVRAHCSNSDQSPWMGGISFQTECEAMTITAGEYLQEGFEDYTGAAYNSNGVIPVCWIPYSTTSVAPHVIGSGSYYYVHNGTKALTFYGSGNNYAALPEITNDLNTLQVKFWMQTESSSNGTLTLGYITDEDDGTFNTFVAIPGITIANNNGSMVERGPYYLNGIPNNATRLVFRWYYSSQYSCCIDDVEVSLAPTCRPVSNVACQSTTAHTATLSWTESGSATAWQVSYSTTASFDPADGTIVDVDANPGTITNLAQQSTTYYAYVRANCGGGDYSDWTATTVTITTIAGNDTPSGLAVADVTISSSQATASWNAVAGNTLHQSYDIYWATADVNTVPDEPAAPNYISGITNTSQLISDLNPSTDYKVWVRDNCGTDGLSAWSSAVTFTTAASCPAPVLGNDAIDNITAHSADVEWSDFDENTSYEVSYRTAAYFDGVVEEFGSSIPTGWTKYTGLLDGNTATLTSDNYGWSFGTGNGVFDNHAKVNIYSNYQRWLVTPAITMPNDAVLNFDLALTAYNGELAAPATTGTDDKFIVLISVDNKATWTTLREWNNSGSTYVYNSIPNTATGENVSIDLSSYAGQNAYIAFYGESTESNADNNLHIDNVAIGANIAAGSWHTETTSDNTITLTGLEANTPYDVKVKGFCAGNNENESEVKSFTTNIACPAPTVLTVGTPTTNSVELSWTENGSATAWQICLNGDEANLVVADANPFTVTGLTSATAYTVKVRANCGQNGNFDDGVSEWSNTENFITECETRTAVGYTENFDNCTAGSNVLPICWSYINTTSSSSYQVYPKVHNSSSNSSPNCLQFNSYYYSYTDYDPQPQYAILPEMSGLAGKQVTLMAKGYYTNSTFKIGTMTNPANASTFVAVTEQALTTSYQQFEYIIPDNAEGHYLAIMIEAATSSRTTNGVYIDDIRITEAPTCQKPTGLAFANVTTTTATLSWTENGSATAWQICLNGDEANLVVADANPFTVTSLTAATAYTAKVRAYCTAEDQSDWSNEVNFTTLCEATTVDADHPFFEGFEGTTFPPTCWSIGSPSPLNGSNNWTRSTSNANNGAACAYSGWYGDIYLYTPTLHIDATRASLSFSSYNTFASSYDKNSVLITTDGGAHWTEIWSPATVTQAHVTATIDMTSYVGQDIQLCFKYEGNNAHGWYIDDVNLYVPTVIEKAIDANKWYAIATPVNNSDLGQQTFEGVTNLTSGTYDLYSYTETSGTWIKATTALTTGKGYIYRRSTAATLSFIGLPNTGDHLVTITSQCPDGNIAGFNLVGNPFPHAISRTDYYTLQPNGSWLAHDAGNIGEAEAFLVYTNLSSTDYEINDVTPSKKSAPAANPAITFTVSNGEFRDVAYARFDNSAVLPKIGHLEPNAPALSIPVGDMMYAIANLDSDCESFVMNFSGMGDYTISASGEVSYLHLIDKVTGSDIDLLSQPSYSFKANFGDISSRFLVKLAPNGKDITDGDFAFRNGNGWTVEGEGTLEAYDAMGRLLFAQEISSSSYQLSTSHFPSAGVYILRLGGNSQKIVVTK